jgi:hypothetical protein
MRPIRSRQSLIFCASFSCDDYNRARVVLSLAYVASQLMFYLLYLTSIYLFLYHLPIRLLLSKWSLPSPPQLSRRLQPRQKLTYV